MPGTLSDLPVDSLVALLLVAVAVAVLAKRLHLPYTVALVLAGLAVGALWQGEGIEISEDLILLIFLPPLLFEGCLNIDLGVLRRNAAPVLLLALPGTLLCILALGAAIKLVILGSDVSWTFAFLLAAMLCPTDPVSVLAAFREMGVKRDLSVIVEGESVFNDGIGVVLFLILLRTLGGDTISAGQGILIFLQEILIGLAVGVALGVIAHWILGHLEDRLIEVMISLILAYGSYLAADRLEGSGVISTVAAGLIMGNYGRILAMSPSARITLSSFWDVGAFLANSMVFLLIGVGLRPETLTRGNAPMKIVGIFLMLLAVRAAITHGLLWGCRRMIHRPPARWAWLVIWGGLRGTIPIALVLSIPGDIVAVPGDTRAVVFGVVLLSLVIQGISLRFVLGWLGLGGTTEEEQELELAEARAISARAAERELEAMKSYGEVPDLVYRDLRNRLAKGTDRATEELKGLLREREGLLESRKRHVATRLLEAQRVHLQRAVRRGIISEDVFGVLRDEIDARLASGEGLLGDDVVKRPAPKETIHPPEERKPSEPQSGT